MPFSTAGLTNMLAEVANQAEVTKVERLHGGLATTTFGVDTTSGSFVVKIFRPTDDRAPMEWERLNFAQRVDVPVPEPIRLDADGRWFGSPALVMTRLSGHGNVHPPDLDHWLQQIAHALATVHATDTADASGPLLPPDHWGNRELDRLQGPSNSALVHRALEALRQHRPDPTAGTTLMHGDYHPGNLLWRDGMLTGVIDWNGARLGSRWFDLAYCRADVAALFGLPAARRLTSHYVASSGATPTNLPVFDLMCGVAARRWAGKLWLPGYQQQGCTDTPRQVAARITPFLRQALAELGA
ncbi:phosphotransferase family protein [Microlunatus sp. GCM10028923]|uniref:phosphotransferase family protein n=1 Tax=Microlunatus sp. GCM10028923 TaxID=3273400 RepID=UPI003606AC04